MKESARMVGGVVAAVELQVESLRLGRLKHLRHDVLPRLAVVANVAHIHRSRGREVALEIIPDGAIVTGPALHSNVEIGLLGCWLAATVLLDSWCFASSNGIHLGQGNWRADESRTSTWASRLGTNRHHISAVMRTAKPSVVDNDDPYPRVLILHVL